MVCLAPDGVFEAANLPLRAALVSVSSGRASLWSPSIRPTNSPTPRWNRGGDGLISKSDIQDELKDYLGRWFG
ncbi:MAG: hypothetical protein CMO80_03130 [Verrucomicrobiales bacterium]|nr:hypothetical protein [Verrucomicrobiales bacterium]